MILPIWARALIAIGALLALLFAYQYWAGEQQSIGYERAVAEVNADKLKKIEAAQAVTAEWKSKYEGAENVRSEQAAKINELATANARAVSAISKLRGSVTSLSAERVSAITNETCASTAIAFAELFGSCSDGIEDLAGKHGELATAADRHAADAKALNDAWPE